jgi:Outer membrane protein beta-barrel family/Carboxypeptidase regulatory-like domain
MLLQKHFTLLTVIYLLYAVPSFAQGKIKGSVKGMIVDTAGKQTLSDATVSITPESDSSDAAFAITDKRGAFLLRNLDAGAYRLLITFEGLQHITRKFSITSAARDIDLGTLYMQKLSDVLQEVVVQRPPMSIKKDTVEYNAEMFATKPNAVVEDQLRKLPGVQVDASGNIIAQGEKVVRVLVNGKRFFSDDPKLASRNFPPDMVEKYQIFDDLDDQSKFTGFDNGNRIKTLNIVTKRDRRQGYFGRAVAGGGTSQDYDESFNFHRFNNDQQISALGQANDINKQNFTSQDILGSSGSRRGSGGGPGVAANQSAPGVTTVWAGGLNYRDAWGPKTEVNGSYFYNFDHVSLARNSLTTKYFSELDDTSNTTLRNAQSYARSQNQRIYFNLEQKIDSSNSFVFRPNLTFQTSRPNAVSVSSTTDQDGLPVSNSNGKTSSRHSGFNINGSNFTFRHKFRKPFRTFSVDLNGAVNNNSGDGYNYAVNNFYRLDSTQILDQHYTDTLHSATFSPTVSYTEPVGRNQIMEFNYNYSYNKSTTINNTYDLTDSLTGFQSFDSLFSNSYRFLSTSNRFTLNYRIQNPKFNVNIGSGIQLTDFNSLNTTKNIDVAHEYVHLTPNANFSYSFTKNQRLRFFYSGRTGTPTPSQLQPLTTTNDNINYVTGNPDLRPQFTHSVRILYSSFNPGTQNVVFATINASTVVNDIQSSIVPNRKGGQTTTYVNLNGTYSVGGYFNYGFALKKPKSNLNFTSNINYAQSQTLVDTSDTSPAPLHDYTRNTTLAETVSWTTNIRKNFDMNFSSASTYNIARNSLHSTQNLDFFTEVLDGEVTAYTNSGWLIATTFTYTYSNTHTPGFNASIPLLSPSIAKELFKKKNGELKLSVFDLLNQSTSVSKVVSLNQVSDTRTTTLSRYLMLTFTYNLNNFAGPKSKRMPGVFPGRGRGGIRPTRGSGRN